MGLRIGIGAVVWVSLFAGTVQANNLVTNGNFDDPGSNVAEASNDGTVTDYIPNYPWALDAPDTALSDFNVCSATSDLSACSPTAGISGAQGNDDYAAFMSQGLASDPYDNRDCLYQYISTTVGDTYDISFWVEITGTVSGLTGLFPEWDWNGSDQIEMTNSFYEPANYGITGPSPTLNTWEEFTFTETATDSNTAIMFHGTDPGGAVLLDNVSVTLDSAPEPTSLLLISSGLVLIGLCRRAKKKNNTSE